MENELTPEQYQLVVDQLAEGRKLEAIKIYRTSTGKGLKEAKTEVDKLVPQLIARDPQKFEKLKTGGGGCSAMILLGVSLVWVSMELFQAWG